MSQEYQWYSVVNTSALEQGDLLLRCPVIKAVWNSGTFDQAADKFRLVADEATYDVVIMTQSCDLVNDKVRSVLVCPYRAVSIFIDDEIGDSSMKHRRRFLEDIRRGSMPGYHMLAESDIAGHKHGIQIVSFYDVFSIPAEFARQLAERISPRLRLMPPYREHLGQAFARFFMRVGLPIDIPSQR